MSATAPVLSPTVPEAAERGRPWWYWPAMVVGTILILSTVRVLTSAHDIDSSGALTAAIGLAMPLALAA